MEADVSRFLGMLETERGCSTNTIAAYRNDLGQFAEYMRENLGLSSWRELGRDHLTRYLLFLRERGYADSTIARKVAAVKSFCGFLVQDETLREDPSEIMPSPRVAKIVPRALTHADMQALLDQPAQQQPTPESLRDRAMLEVLYATGIRVSELTSLDVDDLDLDYRRVRCGRNPERVRWIPLSDGALSAVSTYLEIGRPLLVRSRDQPALFLNHRGNRLTRQGFWLILKSYAEAADLGDITPHTIRHTFAAHALGQGRDLHDVQRILGHTSIATTQVYQQVAEHVNGRERNGHDREAVASTVGACYDSDHSSGTEPS